MLLGKVETMWIESACIQGFKSLADVTLSELDAINVLHGANDTGKSNLLEALDLFAQLLPLALSSMEGGLYLEATDLWPYTRNVFRAQDPPPRAIIWTIRLRHQCDSAACLVRLQLSELGPREIQELGKALRLEVAWPEGQPDEAILDLLAGAKAGFHRIPATRYFQREYLGPLVPTFGQGRHSPVIAANLKQTLVAAFNSLEQEERERFARLSQMLEQHFGLVGFVAGQSKPDDKGQIEYVIGFRRSGMREVLPIEQLGSGVQQILLLLGQMLFNPARIVGIEEPEMNLSPEWQARLMAVFRDLVQPGPGGLDQIFITSHSPEFDCEPNYWKVTYEQDATRVVRMPVEQPGEDLGPYLNSRQQVRIPQRVIDDLHLRHREPVFFYKAEDGRWYIRTKAEVLALMEPGEEYNASSDTDCTG